MEGLTCVHGFFCFYKVRSTTTWPFGDNIEVFFALVHTLCQYMVLLRALLLRVSALIFFVSSQDLRFWTRSLSSSPLKNSRELKTRSRGRKWKILIPTNIKLEVRKTPKNQNFTYTIWVNAALQAYIRCIEDARREKEKTRKQQQKKCSLLL